jgi:hypothetical protein
MSNRDDERVLAGVLAFAQSELPTQADTARALVPAMEAGGRIVAGGARHELAAWTASRRLTLQVEICNLLRGLLAAGDAASLPKLALGPVTLATAMAGRGAALVVDGSARDVFWFQLLALLRSVGFEKIALCPGCGRMMVKIGKRGHCTPRCRAKFYMRAYRSPERVKARRTRRRRRP